MSEERIKIVVKLFNEALGAYAKYFDIKHSEVLVDEPDYLSITISIKPLEAKVEDGVIKGSEQLIEVLFDGTDLPQMIFGEDAERDINFGNIFCYLYWCECISNDN